MVVGGGRNVSSSRDFRRGEADIHRVVLRAGCHFSRWSVVVGVHALEIGSVPSVPVFLSLFSVHNKIK